MIRNRVTIPLPVREDPADPLRGFGWTVVVADPPWSFNDKGHRGAPDQRKKRLGRKGYRTLSVDAIAAIPVASVAEDDALLFLWTTSAHLLDGSATRVARAWGFEPKTTIVWVKARWASAPAALARALAALLVAPPASGGFRGRLLRAWGFLAEACAHLQALVFQIGQGHYTRGAHELVVVATRGRATSLIADRGVPSVVVAPRTEHSAKPRAFRDLVDRLVGRRPVLELFARDVDRPHWTAWGDQAPEEKQDSTDRLCG
jgi:N6-adenosine-specific RNA methylase IME4